MRGLVAAVMACAACGHAAPRETWVEQDAPGTSTRGGVAAGSNAPAGGTTDPKLDAKRVAAIAGGDLAAIDAATAAELEAAYARAPSAAVAVRRALLAHHAGDDDAARAWLAKAAAAKGAATYASQADALRADLGAPVDPTVIAVLLPATGRFAALGDELAAAIKLADPQGARLVFLDTAGDEAKATAAVDRAAALGAIAILGPVGEHEAQAAARRAAERAIPIALLAPGDGADPSSGVFRLVTSPAAEARMAADFAAQEGYPTAGVLAPRDDIGDVMAAAFEAEAKVKGVDVTADGRYDPTASNLEPDVKAFLGLDPATNEKLAAWLHKHGRKGWQTFVPDVPFSLLYVPDQYDRASLVAAYLPYDGVELRTTEAPDPEALKRKYHGEIPQVVQLLGSSGWNHPALVTRGGDAVAGAMIIDVFAGDRDQGPAAELSAKFHDATGRDPSSAAAQAYDAARLVLGARTGAGTRADFTAALARAHLDDGACGAARLDETGAIARTPIVLQVDAGALALVPF